MKKSAYGGKKHRAERKNLKIRTSETCSIIPKLIALMNKEKELRNSPDYATGPIKGIRGRFQKTWETKRGNWTKSRKETQGGLKKKRKKVLRGTIPAPEKGGGGVERGIKKKRPGKKPRG